jgi:hypothetical protein
MGRGAFQQRGAAPKRSGRMRKKGSAAAPAPSAVPPSVDAAGPSSSMPMGAPVAVGPRLNPRPYAWPANLDAPVRLMIDGLTIPHQ